MSKNHLTLADLKSNGLKLNKSDAMELHSNINDIAIRGSDEPTVIFDPKEDDEPTGDHFPGDDDDDDDETVEGLKAQIVDLKKAYVTLYQSRQENKTAAAVTGEEKAKRGPKKTADVKEDSKVEASKTTDAENEKSNTPAADGTEANNGENSGPGGEQQA
ncbi:MAG TPA: hypothetical protein VGN20_20530 [Mucilaginibacter sp.]|jgi:hypothetical protein